MPLEAVMICVDNSEWMRNGDYSPSRLEAQAETVNFIANAKINDNPESEVGLLSMAGSRVELHTSMSRSMATIMTCVQKNITVSGTCRFVNSLKIAQLALKNRQNKNQKQRIIVFAGSPITDETKQLVKLGKVFKKNNVAVDVINFGAENSQNDNAEKLEAFVTAVNSSDNSHLVNIPPGPHILSDLVLSSAIMNANPGAAAGSGASLGGVGGAEEDMDSDLAMAIRMSMEDERQRQEAAANSAGATSDPAATTPAATAAAPMEEEDDDDMDEDALLAQAIALSMQENLMQDDAPETEEPATPATTTTTATTAATTTSTTSAATATAAAEEEDDDITAALQDKDFLENLLSSVPGMDKDDVAIDDILMNLGGGSDEAEKKKDDK